MPVLPDIDNELFVGGKEYQKKDGTECLDLSAEELQDEDSTR